MDNNELNAFIERYATQYTTKTAVLLTGEWGSGKTYFICNVFMEKFEALKKKKPAVHGGRKVES